jgi:hypothetical protein
MSRSAVELLRTQYKEAAQWLDGTMEGVTEEVATWSPPSDLVSPISGQVAHAVVGLDFFLLNMVGGRDPLIATEFAGKGVISEPPPTDGEWVEWGNRVQVDGAAMHDYAEAVFAAIDDLLAGMEDGDLEREVDYGFGTYSAAWGFNIMLLNTFSHTGEIAVLKGLQGLKGYPM